MVKRVGQSQAKKRSGKGVSDFVTVKSSWNFIAVSQFESVVCLS